MSYWSHNPELYDEIIFEEMVRRGLATRENTEDIGETVAEYMNRPDSWKLAAEAERDYWADRVDAVMTSLEE